MAGLLCRTSTGAIAAQSSRQVWIRHGLRTGGGSRTPRAGDRGASFIYTVNVDGTEIRRVTTPTTDSTKTTDLSPAWSPDGRWIAFQREHGCVSLLYCIGSWDIFVTRADGTDLRKVTTDGNSVRPSW